MTNSSRKESLDVADFKGGIFEGIPTPLFLAKEAVSY